MDNSATTPVSAFAARKMNEIINEISGNPSSVHGMGVAADRVLESSRADIITSLGVRDKSSGALIFTGSGTEADNLAVHGVADAKSYRFIPKIITTDSEHPAIGNTVGYLEEKGFEIVRLSTKGGVIDIGELEDALDERVILVSVMRVNNETGAVYDVKKIFDIVKKAVPDAVMHTDAVQGYMKIGCEPKKLGADLVSVSAHKINGPKGIGALWCSSQIIKSKKIRPVIFGGGQEGGFRSGTENLIGIAGFAAAASEKKPHIGESYEKVTALRRTLVENLPSEVRLNQPVGEYLPHIISLTVPGIKSEVLVRYLSEKGIYISAGSACSAKRRKVDGVLLSFGLTEEEADSTVRISISDQNTDEEIAELLSALSEGMKSLQKIR